MTVPARRVAVFAGSFDPPGLHHRRSAERLAGRFDEVVVLPAGPRPGRPAGGSLAVHRAVMADLNFADLPRVRVELGDLEQSRFTHHREFDRVFGGPGVEVAHVVPAEAVRGGAAGASRIQREWEDGPGLWAAAPFVVVHEPHEPIAPADLPPRAEVVEVPAYSSSGLIRSLLFDGDGADALLAPRVADYVRRHGLFRPTPPARDASFRPAAPRFRLFTDERSPAAAKVAEGLRRYESADPEVIVVVGGDGTMLRAIRQHWRARRPFYGINTGHLGFLLNDRDGAGFWDRDLRLYQLPLLWVEITAADGSAKGGLAFNDCWVERQTGQTAWVEVTVNGRVVMPKVVADGMLVATAAGSTSYARAMRATPLPFNAPLLTLAGSNVLLPQSWHPAVLTIDAGVGLRSLDPAKRPLQGFIDGVDQGRVLGLTARVSRTAAVELLFAPEHDPVSKLAGLQFPPPG